MDRAGDMQIKVERIPRANNEFAYFKDLSKVQMSYKEFLVNMRDP